MRRWPSAQASLEASLSPVKYPWDATIPITTFDPATGASRVELERAGDLFNEREIDFETEDQITWTEAEDIAAKRYKRRRGKEPSRSWRYQIKNGLRYIPSAAPLLTSVSDVRAMVDAMEEAGLAATTIQQRTSALSGVIEALIRTGRTEDTYVNPFSRVDTAATGTRHFHKAQPSDYQAMAKWKHPLMEVLMFSGARISEVVNGEYRDGCLIINEGKNRASIRVVPLPTIGELCGHNSSSSAVDLSESSEKCVVQTIDSFRQQFNQHRPHHHLTAHSFRHGWKTAAREAGIDHVLAERLLGHAIPKMDQVYGEFSEEVLRGAAKRVWEVIDGWCQ